MTFPKPVPTINLAKSRAWMAHFVGDIVILRQYAALTADEKLVDDPPTVSMTRADFALHCAEFGLTASGAPI